MNSSDDAQMLNVVLAAMGRSDHDTVLALADVMLERNADHHVLLFCRGIALFHHGRQTEGIQSLQRAIKLHPDTRYLASLAEMQEAAGDRTGAIDTLMALHEAEPCDIELIHRLLRADPSKNAALKKRLRLVEGEDLPEAVVLEARRLYEKNSAAFNAAFPDAGARWGEYARRMRQFILENRSARESILFAQTGVDFESRQDFDEESADLAGRHRQMLHDDYPDWEPLLRGISDSPMGLASTMRKVGNIWISRYLYHFARRIFKVARTIGRAEIVCDIGGGTGLTGRMWLMSGAMAPKTYLIIDLPESLYFSQLYLQAHLGAKQVGMVEDEGLAPHLDKPVILVPIDRIPALDGLRIDLVTNFGSMQEMSEYWVDFYSGVLDRLDARFFYSQNYFAQPVSSLQESANLWAPRLGPKWRSYSVEIDPPMIRMVTTRIFVDWFLKKHDEAQSEEKLLAHFEECILHRAPDAVNLFELIDMFRLAQSRAFALRIIEKFQRFDFKEVLYLAEWIKARYAPPHPALLEAVIERMSALRAGGVESLVWSLR